MRVVRKTVQCALSRPGTQENVQQLPGRLIAAPRE
jgi:hypothetical protein